MTDLRAVRELLGDPSFTPGKKHLPALFDAALKGDEGVARAARKALAGVQSDLAPAIDRRLPGATPSEAAVLVDLAARAATRSPRLDAIATAGLSHDAAIVRRAAATALGRSGAPAVDALRAALERESDDGVRARLVEALGKVGGAAAVDALASAHEQGAAAARALDRARLVARRDAARGEVSVLDEAATLDRVDVVYRCRAGLEDVLVDELAALGVERPRVVDTGVVTATFAGRLEHALRARTALSVAFPAGRVASEEPSAIADAILASVELVTRLTEGTPRFRLEVPDGKRRALVWDVAAGLDAQSSPLVNDPRASTWTATVRRAGDALELEWTPHLRDDRFAYRKADVAASSHPTIAAALARLTGPAPDDVVWDPFVGAGGELCERSLLGPSRALIGTDVDDAALDRARENLASVRATASLYRASATSFTPDAPVDVVVTNPPMGRRVLKERDVAALLVAFLARTPATLARGGRLAWLSPAPRATRDAARAAGLRLVRHADVDMGGFFAELQLLEKPR